MALLCVRALQQCCSVGACDCCIELLLFRAVALLYTAAVIALAYAIGVCCRHVMAMIIAPPESTMHPKCAITQRLTVLPNTATATG